MSEPERGPLEQEIYDLVRIKGLSSPVLMEAQATGKAPSVEDRMLQAERFGFILYEALLRISREVDNLPLG